MLRKVFVAETAGVFLVVIVVGPADAGRLITGQQIKNSSITGADIKDGSLASADFKGSARGPAGPVGSNGAPGAAGPAGITSVRTVFGPTAAQTPGGTGGSQVAGSIATCPAGSVVVGGGFKSPTILNVVNYAGASASTYEVIARNDYTAASSITAQAICAAAYRAEAVKKVDP